MRAPSRVLSAKLEVQCAFQALEAAVALDWKEFQNPQGTALVKEARIAVTRALCDLLPMGNDGLKVQLLKLIGAT